MDEVQDVDVARKVLDDNQRHETIGVTRKQKGKSALQKPTTTPTWRKSILVGHLLTFASDSGADTIPERASFRLADAEVLPNLGQAKLNGSGGIGGSEIQINTYAAGITKPFTSVVEMVCSGMA